MDTSMASVNSNRMRKLESMALQRDYELQTATFERRLTTVYASATLSTRFHTQKDPDALTRFSAARI